MALLLLFPLLSLVHSQQHFVWPHGYLDDDPRIQPFEAIYLNMLAQSAMEYGKDPNIDEFNRLSHIREQITWEDVLKEKKANQASQLHANNSAKETLMTRYNRRAHDDVEGNPFEEIVTRSPLHTPHSPPRAPPPTGMRPLTQHDLPSPVHSQHSWLAHIRGPTQHPRLSRQPFPTLAASQTRKDRSTKKNVFISSDNPYYKQDISQPTIIRLPVPLKV